MRRFLAGMVFVASWVAPASAQFSVGTAPRAPRWFLTATGGFQWGGAYVLDSETSSVWDFDGSPTMRGSLERRVNEEISAGVAWSYARAPLDYGNFGGATACGAPACPADATIAHYGVVGRYDGGGGDRGFHEVVEVFLGAVRYGSFQARRTGDRLPPLKGNSDIAFGASLGFGYRFSPDWEVVLLQDAISSMHERADVVGGAGRTTRQNATRLGVRVGF